MEISREQDLLALIIEQYGDDLRSWSLNQGLEDIKACTIQPHAVSVEKENKRLHDHWSNLANEDIPAAYKDLREKILHRERWNVSLQQEVTEKKLLAAEKADVKNNLHNIRQEQTDVGATVHSITEMSDCDHDFTPNSTTAPLEQVGSLTCHLRISSIVPEHQVDGSMLKLLNNSAQNFSRAVSPNYAWEPETSIASSKDISQEVGILDSLYQTRAESQTYKSPSSLQQFKSIQEDSYPLIGLSRDTTDRVGEPSHSFYPNGSGMLSSYPQGHINGLIQPELQFPIANGCTSSSGHSSCHFQEQKQLLEQMQISERELYMHYNGEHFNGRHPIGHLSPINQLGISSLQSPAIGGLVGQNWFPVERRDYADWSTNQYLRNYQNAERNPFRVLLPSHTSCKTTNSQQFIHANNLPGGAIQNYDNNYPCAPSLPNSSSGHEAPQNSLRTNSILSVNFPQNETYLRGLAENPFLIPRSQ
ncbi:hypothetical protein J5N97_007082 [Dioscorea zingiberensis]|uniref:Uncharacterized protein n=1 Tax=Dioscorea zingiberensis TaxID=325984 RepID=A0A9D5HU68_9LILI|nr:hypothetical protein J5N97_007082 [Dioscorea zingiberensis]